MTLGQAFCVAVMRHLDIPDDKGANGAIAKACGVSYNAVYKWQTGISSPPLNRLSRMCDQLGISLGFVLGVAAGGAS